MRHGRRYYFLAAFALPLFFMMQGPQAVESIHQASLAVVKPLMSATSWMTHSGLRIQENIGIFWKVFYRYKTEDERIAKLESQLLKFDEMQRENARLKALLALKDGLSGKSIAARVVGWDPSIFHKVMILDKGSTDGLRKDMPVFVEEGLVGRIVETGEQSSKVMLITDPESRVSTITAQSRAQGISGGSGSPVLTMTYLDIDSGIQVEEDVLTSGGGLLFPKGIKIGRVQSIKKSYDGLHLEAVIEPYVHFSKIEEVLCLNSSNRK